MTGTNVVDILFTGSPQQGFSLSQLLQMATDAHVDLVGAFRESGTALVIPSVVHWKQNHYAAIVGKVGNHYQVVDPTFGDMAYIDEQTLNDEASGYFIIPRVALPNGWRSVSQSDAAQVFGRGYPYSLADDDDQTCHSEGGSGDNPSPDTSANKATTRSGPTVSDEGLVTSGDGSGSGCPSCQGHERDAGMPIWRVSEPYINLWIQDSPLTYQPSRGPKVEFNLNFKQRDETTGVQPGVSSVSSGWNWSWFSFVDATDPFRAGYGSARVHLPGGGISGFTVAAGGTATTGGNYFNNLRLKTYKNGSGFPTSFEVLYPDGSKLVYGYSDFTVISGWMFLTAIVDAQGRQTSLSYSSLDAYGSECIHVSTITDVDGKTVSLSYGNATYPDLVTQVTDSYSRTVTLGYSAGGELASIQDPVGITTTFAYDASTVPITMVTPYGTNSFSYYTQGIDNNGLDRYITATDPDGGKQVYAFFDLSPNVTGFPTSYSSSVIPSGAPLYTLDTAGRDQRSSFYWNRQQTANLSTSNPASFTAADYKKGRQSRWLGGVSTGHAGMHIDTLSSEQDASPDGSTEGQVTWYDYAGKDSSIPSLQGTQILPAVITRVQPDTSTWYIYYQRNSWGAVTNQIESWVAGGTTYYRTNRFVYDSNDIDLLQQRFNPDGENRLVVGFGYDGSYPHLPVRMTNAVQDVTYYAYDAYYRPYTIQTPANLISTFSYGTDGFVSSRVDSAVGGGTIRTISYTWSNAQLSTRTDERGLVETFHWDYLNRPTEIDFPDSTSIKYAYTNGLGTMLLDPTYRLDRLGNATYKTYSRLRQLASAKDARGNSASYAYCSCGSAIQYITNALSQVTAFVYDYQGHLTETHYPDGTSRTNAYDLLGRLSLMKDGLGNATNNYDNLGRLTSMNNAGGQVRGAVYDTQDRVTSLTDQNGVSITQTFDDSGRVLTKTYPDTGVERFTYSARGLTKYTNQLNQGTSFGYDEALRKTAETNANAETLLFTFSAASDLRTLTDGKSQGTSWGYDSEGRVTSKTNQAGSQVLRYLYDANGRMTNRWSFAKGTTKYTYDANGNVTFVDYPSSTDISFHYDALNRVTNMVDAAGTSSFSFTTGGNLLTEAGPWTSNTVTFSYEANVPHLRNSLSLAQPTSAWTNGFTYDSARRLSTVASPAGTFTYTYFTGAGGTPSASSLVRRLSLPNSSYITNTYESAARLSDTALNNSGNGVLNEVFYSYDLAGQRTQKAYTDFSYVDYTYDKAAQLQSAVAYTSGGGLDAAEQKGYLYDAAWNLSHRTNNGSLTTFGVNVQNQLTSCPTGSPTYDSNGNIATDGGGKSFSYDDENQLTSVNQSGNYRTDFLYDGLGRLRLRSEYTWNGSSWNPNGGVRYIYDGHRVIQERDTSNNPLVSYTRGSDFSGNFEGAGGIGGLLARSHGYSGGTWSTHNYYHADGNGNITYMVNSSQTLAAIYRYDAYGTLLSSSGTLASANVYRFSSKELMTQSSLYYYGFRLYDANLQRWLNRDPVSEAGGINLYGYVGNSPISYSDAFGLAPIPPGVPTPPERIPGGPWKWNGDAKNPRQGTFGPVKPGGPPVNLSYDKLNDYWKKNDGCGGSQRYGPGGDPIGVNEGKKSHIPRNPSGQSDPDVWWPQIIQIIFRYPVIILDPNAGRKPVGPPVNT